MHRLQLYCEEGAVSKFASAKQTIYFLNMITNTILYFCLLISIAFGGVINPTTTSRTETETESTTRYLETTVYDDDVESTTQINTTDDEEESITLNVEQIVVGLKLSMDPEEFNEISKREASENEESNTPSIKDLEDSFGGLNKESVNTQKQASRKIGFYYLVDWNSFLEIDDQLGTSVNLRIQPKFGNPARFIPITVP